MKSRKLRKLRKLRMLLFAFVVFTVITTATACFALPPSPPPPSTNAGLACTFPPTGMSISGNVAICALPPLDANSCVEYHFIFSYGGGIVNAGVMLNGSTAYATVSAATQPSIKSIFELRGKFCNSSQIQQFILNSSLIEDMMAVTGPAGGGMSEDTTAGGTLTLVLRGQRGFGNPDFMGGTVEVK